MAKILNKLAIVSILVILAGAPAFVSAAPGAGIKPGSFFYFFDTTFEKVGLFFTFNPQKKAEKALEYADERLAEIEDVAEEKDSDAIKTAITNYESNVALATEKSKEVKNKSQAENLLNLISDNASKNQEVLTAVLAKVPEEAKEAITRAIEASKRGQEEAIKQITELKKEIAGLKEEIENLEKKLESKENELENNGDNKDDQIKEIDDLKDEIENLKKEAGVPSQQETEIESKEESKNNIVNLPSGAVVEMDASGNVVKTIKEAPEQVNVAPVPVVSTTQTQTPISIQISSVDITTDVNSANIEWETNIPTNSKIFISGGVISSKVFSSQSGLSTRHTVNATGLTGGITYSYEIEAIKGEQVTAETGSFTTLDKSDIIVVVKEAGKIGNLIPRYSWENPQYLMFDFYVKVFNKNGNNIDASITMIAPYDDLSLIPPRKAGEPEIQKTSKTCTVETTPSGCPSNSYYYDAYFSYGTNVSGEQSITFTDGNLTKSVTINVPDDF